MSEYVERLPAARFPLFKDRAPLLSNLDMELTERCNNDCIHCCINLPASDRVARGRELTTEEAKRILREAAELGCLQVRYTGGEPLLRKDFEELYLYARRLGMKVLLFTNARLITKRLASLFARIPPLVTIEVSVYGVHPESYEAVSRVPGSFAQFRRGVGLLLERRVPFVVKGAILPPNRDEIEEFERWAAAIPWMERPPSYSLFFDLRQRRDDLEKNRQIRAVRMPAEEGIAILARDEGRYRREMQEFCGKFMRAAGRKLFACGAGRGCCVDAYGRLQPCLSLRAPEFSYDLRRGTLRQALTEFFPRVLAVEAADLEYLERCARCILKGLCEQCPAKSWAETGRVDKPVEYLCEAAHEQARYLGLLEDSEKAWDVVDYLARIRAI
jgi:radical SAM protein with 4Fe4S-binding SPASM domain